MSKTVLGVFSSEQQAEKAVHALRDRGFTTNEISIVQKNDRNQRGHGAGEGRHRDSGNMAIGGAGFSGDADARGGDTDSVADGVASGATWGGLAGLALGAGALAVPGIGPLLAAGPIAAALTGAATGGLAGGLIDWGVPESVGREYESRVREGGVLAVIRVSEQKADEAAKILREYGASDVGSHDSTK
ncbi:MAG: general stress protein [Bacillota bacterium]|jgi:hypothetical protein